MFETIPSTHAKDWHILDFLGTIWEFDPGGGVVKNHTEHYHEHGVDPIERYKGNSSSSDLQQKQINGSFPKVVPMDLESGTMDSLRSRPYSQIFHPNSFVFISTKVSFTLEHRLVIFVIFYWVVVACGILYSVCLLASYDSFFEICFSLAFSSSITIPNLLYIYLHFFSCFTTSCFFQNVGVDSFEF